MLPRVLTQRNDCDRRGVNPVETSLNPQTVGLNTFGKVGQYEVEGDVYAQPLYVPGVKGADRKRRNLLIVATMHNVIYAFDADKPGEPGKPGKPGKPLWCKRLGDAPCAGQFFNGTYQDITFVPAARNRARIGILSTPVIDAKIDESGAVPTTGIIYLVTFNVDQTAFNRSHEPGEFKHYLHALNLATGEPVVAERLIEGKVAGGGYALSGDSDSRVVLKADGDTRFVLVPVKPDGHTPFDVKVIDATGLGHPGQGYVHFNSIMQLQRPALLLHEGNLIIAFGARGDEDPYHGWIFAYEAKSLKLVGLRCTTPNGMRGGIWQAGQGLLTDSQGNIYAATGNGDARTPDGNLEQMKNLGESFVRFRCEPGGIRVTGWFNAYDDFVRALAGPAGDATYFSWDDDLGASAPALLPDDRIVGGGKDGWFYLIDPDLMDNLGSKGAVPQAFIASYNFARGSRPKFEKGIDGGTHHIHGSPVVWTHPRHGTLVYVWGENDLVRVYQYSPECHGDHATGRFLGPRREFSFQQVPAQGEEFARGGLYASNEVADRKGMPGGMLSLSVSDGDPESAILWGSFPPYGSTAGSATPGALAAFAAGRFDERLGFRRLELLWSSQQNPADAPGLISKFCCPTIAAGRVYYPTASDCVVVYGTKAADGGYDLGFGGTSGLTLNGSAAVSERGTIILTDLPQVKADDPYLSDTPTLHAGSFFTSELVDIRRFETDFDFRLTDAAADGFTFTIQAESPKALGGPGPGLGYMRDGEEAGTAAFQSTILYSVAIGFVLAGPPDPRSEAPSLLVLLVNGQRFAGVPEINFRQGPDPDLRSGDVLNALIRYDGSTLFVRVANRVSGHATSELRLPIGDIPMLIQSVTGSAYVGFTGGTGARSARQEILRWNFRPGVPAA